LYACARVVFVDGVCARSHCSLHSKLMAHFPDIAPIDKALGAVFDRIKAARQPQPK
jgi:hypothetical protein